MDITENTEEEQLLCISIDEALSTGKEFLKKSCLF